MQINPKELLAELTSAFVQNFARPAQYLVRSPGRVILLGEYLEYCQGPVLSTAIDKAANLAVSSIDEAAPGEGVRSPSQHSEMVTVHDHDLGETVSFRLDRLDDRCDIHGQSLPSWALLPAGVAWSLKKDGFTVPGMQALVQSGLPTQIELGHPSAVMAAFALAWQALGGWSADRITLAKLCQRAGEAYAGVACSLADALTILRGDEGQAIYLDAHTLQWEAFPLPAGVLVLIADTGIRREKLEETCRSRQAACQEALEHLRRYKPNLESLRELQPTEFAAYAEYLPLPAKLRAEYVIKETFRIHSVTSALRLGKVRSFSAAIFTSHSNLRDLYEASAPELDRLVAIARELPGCLGARMSAEGLGGCTLNLVDETHAAEFASALRNIYHSQTGSGLNTYLFKPARGASLISVNPA